MRYLFIITIFFFGCTSSQNNLPVKPGSSLLVYASDPGLTFKNGYWYYSGLPFSGSVTDSFESRLHQVTQYSAGKEDGWQLTYFPGGSLAEKRYYTNGEKDSVHTGWWQNGNKRFEYHFTRGIYNGDYNEWYQSGKPLKHILYVNGTDVSGKGWRENGKVYMNFIVKNGRRYGINNSNLCYTVMNGSGELINSLPN